MTEEPIPPYKRRRAKRFDRAHSKAIKEGLRVSKMTDAEYIEQYPAAWERLKLWREIVRQYDPQHPMHVSVRLDSRRTRCKNKYELINRKAAITSVQWGQPLSKLVPVMYWSFSSDRRWDGRWRMIKIYHLGTVIGSAYNYCWGTLWNQETNPFASEPDIVKWMTEKWIKDRCLKEILSKVDLGVRSLPQHESTLSAYSKSGPSASIIISF